jgi:hypothetical protein
MPDRLVRDQSSKKNTLARLLAGEEDDDHEGELDLTATHYGAIAAMVEQLTDVHGTPAQAEKIRAHHRNVVKIASRYSSWALAMRYDVQQRKAAGSVKTHDLAPLDWEAIHMLNLELVNRKAVSTATAGTASRTNSAPSLKRSAPAGGLSGPPAKKSGPRSCFRCGQSGCMPDVCTKTTTTAGKPCVTVQVGGRSARTLLAADGRAYCFNFTYHGSCLRGSACNCVHECSLCGGAHGAGACQHLA